MSLLPFQRLSFFLFLFLILILILIPLYSTCLRIDKCCPPGNALILNDAGNFACECAAKHSQLLDPREDVWKGLPVCDEYSYLVVRLLDEIDRKVPDDACLEIFLDKDSQMDFPIIVHCYSVVDLEIEKGLNFIEDASSLPHILNLRKCCPENSAYDINKKFCIYAEDSLKMLLDHFPKVDFIDINNGPPSCQYALVDYKVELKDIYNEGSNINIVIPWNGETKNITIDTDNSCLDAEPSRNFISARVCSEADYCSSNACIRKCCPENKINNNCLDSPQNVSMENFRTSLASIARNSTLLPIFDIQTYGLMVGWPCDVYYKGELYEIWEIGTFGEVLLPGYPTFTYVNSCLELVYNDPKVESGLYPFYCINESEFERVESKRKDIKAGLLFTSCCFLLATLLVYICLPSLQNLHGKTIMCHVVSLFFSYACLVINHFLNALTAETDDYTEAIICKCLGYVQLFCVHSSFLWLNVMCFDIWWTFRGMQARVSAAKKKRQQRNRFLTYCAYAWGLALLLSSVPVVLEYTELREPFMGVESCWFVEKSIEKKYCFVLPVTITLLVNIIFFIVTCYRCNKIKAEIHRVMANVKDPASRKFHSNKTRLLMNLKLFVFMGMPWILENVQGLFEQLEHPVWLQEMEFVADVVNSLQGLLMFVLLVFKRKVYKALRRRFGVGESTEKPGCTGIALGVTENYPMRRSASNITVVSNIIVNSTTT